MSRPRPRWSRPQTTSLVTCARTSRPTAPMQAEPFSSAFSGPQTATGWLPSKRARVLPGETDDADATLSIKAKYLERILGGTLDPQLAVCSGQAASVRRHQQGSGLWCHPSRGDRERANAGLTAQATSIDPLLDSHGQPKVITEWIATTVAPVSSTANSARKLLAGTPSRMSDATRAIGVTQKKEDDRAIDACSLEKLTPDRKQHDPNR